MDIVLGFDGFQVFIRFFLFCLIILSWILCIITTGNEYFIEEYFIEKGKKIRNWFLEKE